MNLSEGTNCCRAQWAAGRSSDFFTRHLLCHVSTSLNGKEQRAAHLACPAVGSNSTNPSQQLLQSFRLWERQSYPRAALQTGTHGNMSVAYIHLSKFWSSRGLGEQSSRQKPAGMTNMCAPHSCSPAQSAPSVLQAFGPRYPHDATQSSHTATFLMCTRDKRLEFM